MSQPRSLWLETNKEEGGQRLIWLDLNVTPSLIYKQKHVYDSYARAVSMCGTFIEMLNLRGKFASLISQKTQEPDDMASLCITDSEVLPNVV